MKSQLELTREYHREYARKRRASDPEFAEKAREASRKSAAKHPDRARARSEAWRVANKERRAAYAKQYQAENAEAIRPQQAERWVANAERLGAQNKEWKAKNPEYMTDYNRKYTIDRYHADPLFKLKMRERTRINQGLKGNEKAGPSTHLLGCSWEEFRVHIESLFLGGMHWGNSSEWHIDHIRPLASFDLSLEAEQRLAFHYTNHQPLWAADNLKKGRKYQEAQNA